MAKRPVLTEESFLAHLFSPKRNPVPTGLRTRPLVHSKGRTRARVASYNRMSASNQEILRRSGQREAYLRGEVTLKDARSVLRVVAVRLGLAKPLRPSKRPVVGRMLSDLDVQVASHIVRVLRQSGRKPNVDKIHKNIVYLPEEDLQVMEHADAGRITAYAGDGTKYVIFDGKPQNPLWYH